MKKKLFMLLCVISLSLATVFATSSFTNKQDSIASFETQVGYSTNALNYKVEGNSNSFSVEENQKALSLGEKVTLYTNFNTNFITAATFNFTLDGKNITKIDLAGIETNTTVDLNSDEYQNNLNFFIGVEKTFISSKGFTADVAIGPNFMYFFENSDDNTSYYAYGIEGIINLNYTLTPEMKVTLGLNASYDPFCGGDRIDQENNPLLGEYSDYVYSITPKIGFVYYL